MTPQDVLLAMHAKYAGMRSYQDRGVVLTKLPSKQEPDELTFVTFFRRPDRFRFEWTRHHPYEGLRHVRTHRVIWSDGIGTFLYSDRDGTVERQESLKMAFGVATGVSSGAAHTVSALLMADVGGSILPQLQGLTVNDGECDGVPCYRIGGYHPQGDFYEVYTGLDDLLLHRVSKSDRAALFQMRFGEIFASMSRSMNRHSSFDPRPNMKRMRTRETGGVQQRFFNIDSQKPPNI